MILAEELEADWKSIHEEIAINLEAPIHLSNIMIYCAACQKPTRVGTKQLADGSRARVCKKCGQAIEVPTHK